MKDVAMQNKVALVTGAASGLGLATALKLAAAGANICLVDINKEALEVALSKVTEHGVRAITVEANLADPDACINAIDITIEQLGRLDALCNVAAIMKPNHTTEVDRQTFETTLAVNLGAPFFLSQAAIPHLLESGGAIVNVASAVGIAAQAYNAAYCATKAGLIQMTKSLAMEYMHKNIRINAVAPGGMMTPLARNMMAVQDPDPSLLAKTTPMRGLVEVDEVADMIAFLASEKAQGYHGSCVVIDKGMCAG